MEDRTLQRPTKLFNPMYILMLLLSAIANIAFQMVSPIILKYAVSIGTNNKTAGTLVGIYSLVALVARPVAGLVSDRINKKWVMMASTAVMGLAVLSYSLTTNIALLFAVRVVHGISFSVTGTLNVTFANEYVPEGRTGEGIGYLGLSYALAQALGPGIGLKMIDYSYQTCFRTAAVVLFAAAAIMCFLKYSYRKKPASEVRRRLRLNDLVAVELLMLSFFALILSMANGIVSGFIALLADERGLKNISIFFTINAVAMFVTRPVAGKLVDKKGVAFIAIPSLFFSGLSMLLVGMAKGVALIVAAALIKAVANGSGQPAVQAECIRRLSRERSGVAASTYFIGADLGQGLSSIIGGAIADSLGYAAVFYVFSGVAAAAVAVAAFYFRLSPAYKKR